MPPGRGTDRSSVKPFAAAGGAMGDACVRRHDGYRGNRTAFRIPRGRDPASGATLRRRTARLGTRSRVVRIAKEPAEAVDRLERLGDVGERPVRLTARSPPALGP